VLLSAAEAGGNGVLLVLPAEECSRNCAWRPLCGRVPQRAAVRFTPRTACNPRHSSVGRSHGRQRFAAPICCFSSDNGWLLTSALLKQSIWLICIQEKWKRKMKKWEGSKALYKDPSVANVLTPVVSSIQEWSHW